MTKKFGILVTGEGHDGTWMSDSWHKDKQGDWFPEPALYTTMTEAKADAKLFSKDSKYQYVAMKYKENP